MYVCLCVSAFIHTRMANFFWYILMKVFLRTHPIIDFDKSAFQNKINNISKIVYKIEVGRWKFEEEKQHWISFLLNWQWIDSQKRISFLKAENITLLSMERLKEGNLSRFDWLLVLFKALIFVQCPLCSPSCLCQK